MKLLNWILDHPVTVSMFYVALLIISVICFAIIPVELSPHIELPELKVSASWYNTSAVTIEARVTSRLESAIQGLRGVTRIESRTREGSCDISVEFEKNTDLQLVELELNEKICQLYKELPARVSWPEISRSVPEEMQEFEGFMRFQLIGDLEAGEIRKFAREKLLIPLSSVQGVENVEVRGGEDKVLKITLDQNAIESFRILQADLVQIQRSLSLTSASLGNVYSHGAFASLKFDLNFENIDQIKTLPVKQTETGRIIRLEDIAHVKVEYQQPFSIIRINGKNLVTLNLDKEPGVNLLKTAYCL